MNPKEFWEYVEKRHKDNPSSQDGEFDLVISLADIRARCNQVPPTYTPIDDGDFAGPVERWYGVVDSRCFMLTYYYRSEDSVMIQYENTSGTESVVRKAIDEWKNWNPF